MHSCEQGQGLSNLVEVLLKHLSWVMDETSVSTREYGYYMLVVLCG